jgi:hypothetical protein
MKDYTVKDLSRSYFKKGSVVARNSRLFLFSAGAFSMKPNALHGLQNT